MTKYQRAKRVSDYLRSLSNKSEFRTEWMSDSRKLHKGINEFTPFFPPPFHMRVGRDSSIGIATGYGLEGPGIESR